MEHHPSANLRGDSKDLREAKSWLWQLEVPFSSCHDTHLLQNCCCEEGSKAACARPSPGEIPSLYIKKHEVHNSSVATHHPPKLATFKLNVTFFSPRQPHTATQHSHKLKPQISAYTRNLTFPPTLSSFSLSYDKWCFPLNSRNKFPELNSSN